MRGRPVVVISQLPPPVHGSTIVTGTLLAVLRELGYEPTLVDRRFSSDVVDVGRPSIRKVARALGLVARLLNALVKVRPEAIIFFATSRTGSFLVDCGLSEVIRLIRRMGVGVKVVHYLHTQGFRQLASRGGLWARLVKRQLELADIVVSLSPILETDVAPWVPSEKRVTIPNTVTRRLARPEAVAGDQGSRLPTALFLSNLMPGKGALEFLHLAAALIGEGLEARFVLAGGGASPEYRRALDAELASADRQRLIAVGPVSGNAKWKLLEDADVLVFPSALPEAQPLTIIEASATGTPSIAFDLAGIPFLVRDGITGVLVPTGDLAAMKKAVRNLLSVPELRVEMGRSALRDYESRFSPAAFAGSWSALMSRLLDAEGDEKRGG